VVAQFKHLADSGIVCGMSRPGWAAAMERFFSSLQTERERIAPEAAVGIARQSRRASRSQHKTRQAELVSVGNGSTRRALL
jgi:hypothetical protein